MKANQKGFSVVEGLIIVFLVVLIGGTGWYVWQNNNKTTKTTTIKNSVEKPTEASPPAAEISIAELAKKVEENYQIDTTNDISIIIERESLQKGPKYKTCGSPEDPNNKQWVNVFYYPTDNTLDVYYSKYSEGGVVVKSDGYKDDTSWSARRDDFGKNNANKDIIDGLLNNSTSESVVAVNDDGTINSDNKVKLFDFNGESAYSYIVKIKNDTSTGECAPELRRFIISATDFDGLAEEIYYGSVKDTTLSYSSIKKVEKRNVSRQEALKILEKEGYKDSEAQNLKSANGE
jgi:hypothetical protein